MNCYTFFFYSIYTSLVEVEKWIRRYLYTQVKECTSYKVLLFNHFPSLVCSKQWKARWRRRWNISQYIDSNGSRGNGWVIHLIKLLQEEELSRGRRQYSIFSLLNKIYIYCKRQKCSISFIDYESVVAYT